jgi:ferrous-iron efflux pump FieF
MKLPTSPSSAIHFAMIISVFLAGAKLVIWLLSGSLAILGSALDSLMDMMVSGVNALALKLSGKKSDAKYSYGLGKIQGFAAIFEGVIVLGSGIFLGYAGIMSFLEGRSPVVTSLEMWTMILAIVGTWAIMWNYLRIARIHDSLLTRADALHYSSDLVMNIGILIALVLTRYLGLSWIDAVFATLIALWIIWNALPIIWSGISMLLDSALSDEEVREIEKILQDEKSLESYHYLRTRRSWDDIFIEAHIVYRDKSISLHDAHEVTDSLESALGARYPGAHIMLHPELEDEPEMCEVKR